MPEARVVNRGGWKPRHCSCCAWGGCAWAQPVLLGGCWHPAELLWVPVGFDGKEGPQLPFWKPPLSPFASFPPSVCNLRGGILRS